VDLWLNFAKNAAIETGDLTQWYDPLKQPGCDQGVCNGGGEFDSGCAGEDNTFSVPSQDFALSGRWSDKLSVLTPTPASLCPGHINNSSLYCV
jgi:hypothetical protein